MDKKDINITIVENEDPEVKFIKLEGILDALTSAKLDKFMFELVRKGNICLIVDCGGLTYVNSTGLSSLILYHIQMKRRSGALKLIKLSDVIRDLMDVSGADKLLKIYNSREEAEKDWKISK
ncbi:MAG: hypothetical protein COV72_01375 [Candidatus Omnitrophica bacterium CG11_big_fil_rev_8_21_14_0_20_42_13]|uniref:Anti-sigma factor antagonist n=1 Tax=Candidatus Ghiorseimicrobium undicola TaxID=1974746 RepID=A0A2H0LZI0_9BACT|nr:MAG: hypothetical protein COV72_01375 [Candidatus Omnitrophica bacterium CG11_big_fil_rev_8_21_14_0_20_42_13]